MTAIIWPARSAVQPVGRTKLHIGGCRDATGTLMISKVRIRRRRRSLGPHGSPWSHNIYTDATNRGHDHPHAIHVLARAWIRVIHRCWLDGVPYDPAKHGTATKINQPVAA